MAVHAEREPDETVPGSNPGLSKHILLVRDAYLKDTQNTANVNKGLSSSMQTVGEMSNELSQVIRFQLDSEHAKCKASLRSRRILLA